MTKLLTSFFFFTTATFTVYPAERMQISQERIQNNMIESPYCDIDNLNLYIKNHFRKPAKPLLSCVKPIEWTKRQGLSPLPLEQILRRHRVSEKNIACIDFATYLAKKMPLTAKSNVKGQLYKYQTSNPLSFTRLCYQPEITQDQKFLASAFSVPNNDGTTLVDDGLKYGELCTNLCSIKKLIRPLPKTSATRRYFSQQCKTLEKRKAKHAKGIVAKRSKDLVDRAISAVSR